MVERRKKKEVKPEFQLGLFLCETPEESHHLDVDDDTLGINDRSKDSGRP